MNTKDSAATPGKKNSTGKPGPKPETVKIEGDWGGALKKALAKKKPAEGWPKPGKKP